MGSRTGLNDYVLVHGAYGGPDENWLPALAAALRGMGHQVALPKMPTPEDHCLANWTKAFYKQVSELSPQTFLVGHSLGCAFILRLLEASPVAVRGVSLVSGWTGSLGIELFDSLNQSFFQDPFNWPRIKSNAGTVNLYHGTDDPYVPLALGVELAVKLSGCLRIIPDGGHLNSTAGYLEFSELLLDLKRVSLEGGQ